MKVGKYCEYGLLGYRDGEVSVCGRGGRGELLVWLVKFKLICKAGLLDHPDHPDQHTYKP